MPEHTVVRSRVVAPPVGRIYAFSNGGRTFAGTVIRVAPMRNAKTHVAVTVELTTREHRRLILGEQETGRSHQPQS